MTGRAAMVLFGCALLATPPARAQESAPTLPLEWISLAPGVRYRVFSLVDAPLARAPLHIVEVSPESVRPLAYFAAREGIEPLRAGEWCAARDLMIAINLGMYDTDGHTHIGYARSGERVMSRRWVRSYQSGLVFEPRDTVQPWVTLLDLDLPGARERMDDYEHAIQNLRLIASPGVSKWEANPRRWSEAALAQSREGALLLVFSPTPCTMPELNARLLELPLDIERAMHLEGGAQASLSIHTPALTIDLSGELLPGVASVGPEAQWPIPNVLGFRARD